MLVLGLKPGERVTIGGNIEVRILDLVNLGLVRIGIEAPPEVKILRGRLIEKDRANKGFQASRSDEKGSP